MLLKRRPVEPTVAKGMSVQRVEQVQRGGRERRGRGGRGAVLRAAPPSLAVAGRPPSAHRSGRRSGSFTHWRRRHTLVTYTWILELTGLARAKQTTLVLVEKPLPCILIMSIPRALNHSERNSLPKCKIVEKYVRSVEIRTS